ncbi:hypothetical protein GL213_01895 [Halogeometricum borinquense]|uniref:Uncharacterized protein n=1 Tax=Halogeometricum borinquense TaxID=60847 RepID=A0A6C0UKX7_9EURY|nr:hypothetical protein [Halogeometricum borinquense]QIB76162.1 hypothetical protein G3I44_18950 [Halogeometricum borinquense]QIQ75398.1 hypothetical protein GL213_01895 [Halogeometricum borinquense]
MSERVPSDHDSVMSYRATIARSGGTRRPCLRLPDEVTAVEDGDIIRLSLGGELFYARVTADSSGRLLRGAYDNKRLARTPGEGTNRLVEWCEETSRDPGSAVEFDELDAGFCYGLREPGKRTVYSVPSRPNESLANIAEKLTRDE